jgi:uncharacterized protein (TIGR04255 family)
MTVRAFNTVTAHRTNPRPRYKNPPIIEAILNIQVNPAVEALTLSAVVPTEPLIYTSKQVMTAAGFTIDVANGIQSSLREEVLGYRYANEANTQAVQIRRDGFAFSQLAPYPLNGWEDWRPEAERLWNAYRAATNPVTVVGLQVRYANRIRIPETRIEPGEYFSTYFATSNELPDCNNFFLRSEFAYPDLPTAKLLLSQGTIRDFPEESDVMSILLDLDVSRSLVVPASDPTLWDMLEDLHERETDAFEACITNHTRELFNK